MKTGNKMKSWHFPVVSQMQEGKIMQQIEQEGLDEALNIEKTPKPSARTLGELAG